jgi:hypothetical protein
VCATQHHFTWFHDDQVRRFLPAVRCANGAPKKPPWRKIGAERSMCSAWLRSTFWKAGVAKSSHAARELAGRSQFVWSDRKASPASRALLPRLSRSGIFYPEEGRANTARPSAIQAGRKLVADTAPGRDAVPEAIDFALNDHSAVLAIAIRPVSMAPMITIADVHTSRTDVKLDSLGYSQ